MHNFPPTHSYLLLPTPTLRLYSTKSAKRLLAQITKSPSVFTLIVITPSVSLLSIMALVLCSPIAMHAVAQASASMQLGATMLTLSRLYVSLVPVFGFTMWLNFLPLLSLYLR